MQANGIPDGFKELKIEDLRLYSNGKILVVCGEPPEDDYEAEAHDCDSMGCNWEHVLMSLNIKGICNKLYIDHVLA